MFNKKKIPFFIFWPESLNYYRWRRWRADCLFWQPCWRRKRGGKVWRGARSDTSSGHRQKETLPHSDHNWSSSVTCLKLMESTFNTVVDSRAKLEPFHVLVDLVINPESITHFLNYYIMTTWWVIEQARRGVLLLQMSKSSRQPPILERHWTWMLYKQV